MKELTEDLDLEILRRKCQRHWIPILLMILNVNIKEIQKSGAKHLHMPVLLLQWKKKQAKMENPLNIENEDIVVYGDLPINALAVNDQVIIRNEGSQTAKTN